MLLILCIHVPAVNAGDVLLVQGTTSVRDAEEHGYAGRLTTRLDEWLKEFGLETTHVTDDELTEALLGRTQTVLLPYNPHPDARQLRLLQRHVARGGKIIVFYSASEGLAQLMGVRLGEYKASGTAPRWWAFRFHGREPAFLPDMVWQDSRSIRPVYPRHAAAETIAFWEDSAGRRLDDPACVRSPHGFWVTHVMLDQGSRWPKKQLLLALIAANDPSIWRKAAAAALRRVDGLGTGGSFDEALTGIERMADEEAGLARPPVELARARALHAELRGRYAAAEFGAVVVRSKALRDLVAMAYGRAQASQASEFRGLWDHSGLGLYPGDWDRTCRIAASHGFTDIFPNVQWAGLAHYESDLLTRSAVWRRHGDQVAQAVRAAHRHGLKLHAWKICWKLGAIPDAEIRRLTAAERLQRDDDGKVLHWLCPSNPENVAQELAGIRELLVRYDLDGIHLDYIRFPGPDACYCKGCRLRFEAEIGRRVERWPDDARTGLLAARHEHWRRAQINRLVQGVRDAVDATGRRIRVSAAVYGKYPSCARSVAQDWGIWLRSEMVDFVCPMNYTTNLSEFVQLTRTQLALPRARGRVCPGIGATASMNRLGPMAVIDQIRATRQEGAAGFALFQLDRALETEILPVLSVGTTRHP